MSEWVIYLLVGIGITILICCIFWLSKPRSGGKDGFLDYYNIETYLKSLPNTMGRYVRIRPNLSGGDGHLHLAAITVLDINGYDISTGKSVYATPTYNSPTEKYSSASVVVNGSARPAAKFDVWQSATGNRATEYWEVDLGSVQQISKVEYYGRTDCCNDRNYGVRIQILLTNEVNPPASSLVVEKTLQTTAVSQSVFFVNSYVFSPPNIAAQPEVYYLGGSPAALTQQQAEASCNVYGATLASEDQLFSAFKNGAVWTTPGWTKNGAQTQYPTASGITFAGSSPAGANCFGIKPATGISSGISPFSTKGWSQYSAGMVPYYGDTTIKVPDIIRLKEDIQRNPSAAFLQDPAYPPTNDAAVAAPLNYLWDVPSNGVVENQIPIQIFGEASASALTQVTSSLDLSRRIYLGSDSDVEKFLNISLRDLKPYFRNDGVRSAYCRPEIKQIVVDGDFQIVKDTAAEASNAANCAKPITSDMLSLLPYNARNYVKTWIYNRIQRMMSFKFGMSSSLKERIRVGTETQNNPTFSNRINDERLAAAKAELLAVNKALDISLNAVSYMVPTSNGIDYSQKYTLDSIAQHFYETMQGMYVMSHIYDVLTIGSNIMDVRFDMTKHGDISPMREKIAKLRAKYLAVKASNVTQDILETAKTSYQDAVAVIQQEEVDNVLEPQAGVVARFFYTLSNGVVNITGFTMDSRAVTSFIPEMNCGLQVATGTADGNVNYDPVTVYTKNISMALVCNDPNTIKSIIDDYIDASTVDLQETLMNAKPSMDTTFGAIQVSQIVSSVQVSPTQCAMKWVETLFDPETNLPVSAEVTNVTRRALFTYTPNTEDWYGTDLNFDASGFILYSSDTIPECIFNPTHYIGQAGDRLVGLNPAVPDDLAKIRKDFLENVFTGTTPTVCPDVLPNYNFNGLDYLARNPDFHKFFNNGGSGPVNMPGLKSHYIASGINEGRSVKAAQTITPLPTPVVIPKPMPAEYVLDNAGGACPTVSCNDADVLYTLVDQYNAEPTLPGSILRVTRAFTPNPSQCDVEVEINYDAMMTDENGKTVKKGASRMAGWGGAAGRFFRIESGMIAWQAAGTKIYNPVSGCKEGVCPGMSQTACGNYTNITAAEFNTITPGPYFTCSMMQKSGIVQKETLAFTIAMDPGTCSVQLYDSSGAGTGTSIQPNTPALYKPMEYAAQFQQVTSDAVKASISAITAAAGSAAATVASVLPPYRINTLAAVGDIQYLGTCQTMKCISPTILGAMTAYYKTQNLGVKQINTIQKVGTSSSTTCDITYQEDTLAPAASGIPSIRSSQTAAMRFTVVPVDSAQINSCNFKVTGMTPILPTPPSAAINDTSQAINVASTLKPGFMNGRFLRNPARGWICWQANGTKIFNCDFGCGTLCPGVDPCDPKIYVDIPPAEWDAMYDNGKGRGPKFTCDMLSYTNPTKEAFGDYSSIRVSESTYPLNASAFGLDKARNKAKTELKELYKEPLYQSADVEMKPGSLAALKAKETPSMPAYKYIRFRPVETRVADSFNVAIGRITLYLDGQIIDMRGTKASNPMGTWVGQTENVTGATATGWSDDHKKALMFAFPYPTLVNGYTWTTAAEGVEADPIRWKLEGSTNGTYWTTLQDQTRGSYATPYGRGEIVGMFSF